VLRLGAMLVLTRVSSLVVSFKTNNSYARWWDGEWSDFECPRVAIWLSRNDNIHCGGALLYEYMQHCTDPRRRQEYLVKHHLQQSAARHAHLAACEWSRSTKK
jgi:hypothetical protein